MTLVERLRAAGCVFAEDEATLLTDAADAPASLEAMTRRRIAGEPLEVILGWAEFRGLRVAIDAGVFVPRQRTTGFLAGLAIGLAPRRALDLCCGSGAIGAALLAEVPGVELWATDVDPVAVACARRNVSNVVCGDLFAALPAGLRFDVIVANAPYVPSAAIVDMPSEARDHEPLETLDGGPDGLDVHRRIAAEAKGWLEPGGSLLVEVGESQVEALVGVFEERGLAASVSNSRDDAWVLRGRA